MSERQGTGDGFCGVYAICHVVTNYSFIAHARVFKALLEQLERLNLLTADRISGKGYSAAMLEKAFNGLSEKIRKDFVAVTLPKFKRKYPEKIKILHKLIEQGLRFILNEDGPGHWIAVMGIHEGELECFDPFPSDRTKSISRRKIEKEGGLIIAPKSIWNKLSA